MRGNKFYLSVGSLLAVFLLSGCGTSSVTNLFKRGDGEKAPRGREAVAETKSDDPLAKDAKFVGSSLESERERLAAQAKEEFDKLNTYIEKQRELGELIEEYRLRHLETQRRMTNIDRVINAIETDPYVFSRDGTLQKSSSQPKQPASENISAMTPGKVDSWHDSVGVASEVSREKSAKSFGSRPDASRIAPPVVADDDAIPTLKRSSRKIASPISGDALEPLNTTVLACEGKGGETMVILGAGTRNGVDKGMFFSVGADHDKKAVFVVTETYPTYSKAVPHPKYPVGSVHVRDAAQRMSHLPGE